MSEEKQEKKRKKTKVKPWTQNEIKILVKAHKAGKKRGEIVKLLSRSQGSVANKIRLLIGEGRLKRRR